MKSNLRLFGVLAFIGISLITAPRAHAALSPLGVSIIPPLEFPPEDFAVTGVRVSVLWGKTRDVYGFDFGLVGNVTQQNFVGIGVSGLFNLNEGAATVIGLQLAGGANINVNKAQIYGLQVAGGVNSNQAESTVVGVQLAALSNYSPYTKVYGAQISLYNRAREVNGFQIGLFNVADSLHGIQIGLLNFNHTGLFAVAPILNIGF
jgi:hypothetical protein